MEKLEQGIGQAINLLRTEIQKEILRPSQLQDYSREILKYEPENVLAKLIISYYDGINQRGELSYRNYIKSLYDKEIERYDLDDIVSFLLKTIDYKNNEEIIEFLKKKDKYEENRKFIENQTEKWERDAENYTIVDRDIFVAHSSLDIDRVKEIVNLLEDDGNSCWVSYRNLDQKENKRDYWDTIKEAEEKFEKYIKEKHFRFI